MVVVQLDGIRSSGGSITRERIEDAVTATTAMWLDQHPEAVVNEDVLVRELEASHNVYVGTWNALADDGDHVVWLSERRDEVDWRFWGRYWRHLINWNLAPQALQRLDEITTDILGRLEDPRRPGAWDRRGLVAGQVQSGKTANYIGLVCKALDAGYKLIVIMAGVHNSLRSQTQSRIDEGVLGFDTRKNLRFDQHDAKLIGVGRLAGPFLHVSSFTSSKQAGDFSRAVATNIGVAVGGNDPVVLVVKKNKSILTNLHAWATELRQEIDPETGHPTVRGVPVLVVDDEADHASVDTNGPRRGDTEHDPSVINGLIRKFLKTFEQTSYVAYTATPFANIFINPEGDHDEAGEDIFPRSFIVNLPAPSTYVGPAKVFGLREDVGSNIEAIEAVPIVRHVEDHGEWMPDRHKSSHQPEPPLPDSLKDALLLFLVAGAIRELRGQIGQHNSMLIHVTRFTAVQRFVALQVQQELEETANRLLFGEGANPALERTLKRIYERDVVPTADAILRDPDLIGQYGEVPSFAELKRALPKVAERTRVHVINGTSADAFEYIDHPDGVSAIAIGGNKLSRGLTLEGLTVSYYLRSTRMYDTLMQMGRWFGYRPGYLDVCRLFTTPELERWYAAITAASEELHREFDYMAAAGRTPRDFGLRVKQHPDGLLVTSPAKLRHARRLSISFAGTISESIIFQTDKNSRHQNWRALEQLLSTVTRASKLRPAPIVGIRVWTNVSAQAVLAFLGGYSAHADALKAQPKALGDYIRSRTHDHPAELTHWTVVLASNDKAQRKYPAAGLELGLIRRSQYPSKKSGDHEVDRYSVRRLVSPPHERIDVVHGSPAWERALRMSVEAWQQNSRRGKPEGPPSVPAGPAVRAVRNANDGVLIIYPLDPSEAGLPEAATPFVGFALSFPASEHAQPIRYQVNEVFWQQELQPFDSIDDDRSDF